MYTYKWVILYENKQMNKKTKQKKKTMSSKLDCTVMATVSTAGSVKVVIRLIRLQVNEGMHVKLVISGKPFLSLKHRPNLNSSSTPRVEAAFEGKEEYEIGFLRVE